MAWGRRVRRDLRRLLPAGVPAPLRRPVPQHHGHGGRGRLHHHWLREVRGWLAYYVDLEDEGCKTYPSLLFDRDITDGRGMMCSVLTPAIGSNQGMGDVEYGRIYDVFFPPEFLRLFDGPSCNIMGTTNANVCTADGFSKCAGAGVLHRPGGRGVRDLPLPALRPRHLRRPRHDVLRAGPGRRDNQGLGDVG